MKKSIHIILTLISVLAIASMFIYIYRNIPVMSEVLTKWGGILGAIIGVSGSVSIASWQIKRQYNMQLYLRIRESRPNFQINVFSCDLIESNRINIVFNNKNPINIGELDGDLILSRPIPMLEIDNVSTDVVPQCVIGISSDLELDKGKLFRLSDNDQIYVLPQMVLPLLKSEYSDNLDEFLSKTVNAIHNIFIEGVTKGNEHYRVSFKLVGHAAAFSTAYFTEAEYNWEFEYLNGERKMSQHLLDEIKSDLVREPFVWSGHIEDIK